MSAIRPGGDGGKSILAVDFGSVNTRLMIIDLVDGQYRLVTHAQTRTTMRPPIGDVTIGLSRAIENLQEATGRILVDEGGLIFPENPDGSGIDRVIATSSAGRPLRAVLVGLMRGVSLASARRALNGTYIEVAELLSVADQRSEEARINAILKAKPDLIFISGGTDGGNQEAVMELVHLVDLAVKLLQEDERPTILYAGNDALAERILNLLQAETNVFVAGNVRPDLTEEKLGSARVELANVYSAFLTSQPIGGFAQISQLSTQLSDVGIVPTAQSITNMVRWLGEVPQKGSVGVLHLDIGSATSTLVASIQKQVNASIHSELGVGHSLLTSLATLDLERVLRWLPFAFTEDDLWNYAHTKVLMPGAVPQSTKDLLVEQAVAREIVRYMVDEARESWKSLANAGGLPPFRPIILAGAALTETPHPGVAAMLMLDALEIEGITTLYTDPFAVIPVLGAIAYVDPTVTVQVFEHDGLTNLGLAFCASGRPRGRRQRPAMRIRITLSSGRVLDKALLPGDIWAAPLSSGQEAQLDIRMGRGMRINGKRRIKQKVVGGAAGLIFDARGRPLSIPAARRRPAVYAQWWEGVTGQTWADLRQFAEEEPLAEIDRAARESRRDRFAEEKALQEIMAAAALSSGFDEAGQLMGGRDIKRRGRKPPRVKKVQKSETPDILERF